MIQHDVAGAALQAEVTEEQRSSLTTQIHVSKRLNVYSPREADTSALVGAKETYRDKVSIK